MIIKDETSEAFMLSACLKNPRLFLELELCEDDFTVDFDKHIYTKALETYCEKGDVNFIEFSLALGDDEARDYLTGLYELYTGGVDVYLLSDMLKENTVKRRLLESADKIKNAIARDERSEDVIAEFNSLISNNRKKNDFILAGELTEKIFKSLDEPKRCYSTGLRGLDRVMGGGLYEGRVYGFAGREKAGKTTLAHTMSYNLSKQGVKHLYVAMEMGAEEIHTKNIARDVGVNSLQFLTNRDDMKKYAKDADYRSNIIYADLAGGRINEILGKVAIAKQLHGISGFFLDYLQIIEGAERGENRAEFLLRAAQSVANFTKRTGLWCVMLAQLNEDGTVFQTSGLRKACDQLYALQSMEAHNSWNDRWLRMDASRYTPIGSLGNPTVPYLRLNQHVGTYFDEVEYLR